ncbi:radical SAM/SPASM domain-containing protein [Bacillus cereus]|uniref:radical SAM/SPASM peptide maturase WgkB n=1 Tax=Bacillus cereus TaxID=1396 RepID=UPI0021002607|nr:radical SAM protein [Bacillus cereus]
MKGSVFVRNYYSAPSLVDISITNRCNLKCDYCYASSSPFETKNEEMDLNHLNNLFQDLDDMNVHRISLTGGEPFIRDDFFEILSATQKYKFAKIINSNGILISDKIASKLSKFDFDRICITLDGSCPEVHDIIRGHGSFKKTIRGIKNLQKYNLPVSTLFTLNKTNVNDLINTIKLNELLGITYMTVMVVCPTGRASDGSILADKNNWYPMFLNLSEMKSRGDIKLNFKIIPPNESPVFWLYYFPLEHYNRLDLLSVWDQDLNLTDIHTKEREISCQAGVKACSIAYNGDVFGCDLMMGIDQFRAGNIKSTSIKEIWNESSVFNKLRNISFDNINGKCGSCSHKWCGGGCRSSAFNLTNSIYGSDNSCFFEESVANG